MLMTLLWEIIEKNKTLSKKGGGSFLQTDSEVKS